MYLSNSGLFLAPTLEVGSDQNVSDNITVAAKKSAFKGTMCEVISHITQENYATLCEFMKIVRTEELARTRISDVYFPSYYFDSGIEVRE